MPKLSVSVDHMHTKEYIKYDIIMYYNNILFNSKANVIQILLRSPLGDLAKILCEFLFVVHSPKPVDKYLRCLRRL